MGVVAHPDLRLERTALGRTATYVVASAGMVLSLAACSTDSAVGTVADASDGGALDTRPWDVQGFTRPGERCEILRAIPDLDEAAFTPREDRIAESIALECSDGAFPDVAWTKMIEADLSRIRAVLPEVGDIEPYA